VAAAQRFQRITDLHGTILMLRKAVLKAEPEYMPERDKTRTWQNGINPASGAIRPGCAVSKPSRGQMSINPAIAGRSALQFRYGTDSPAIFPKSSVN
jgi:hypothetical protein